jgi:hypothetical protein
MCTALLGLHAFTHCNSTSAFKGKGKVRQIKLLEKTEKYQKILGALGDHWDVSNTLENELEAFTCAMYGRKNDTNVDHLRYTILREKSGGRDGKIDINRNVDLSLLPPCKKSLVQHIHRANYQVAIWNRSHIAIQNASKPTEGHGWKLEDGVIKPL